jgi:hypothetical protein
MAPKTASIKYHMSLFAIRILMQPAVAVSVTKSFALPYRNELHCL